MSKFKQLINVHSHTHHSLDGAATVEQIIKRNLELGAPYTAVTEHGNMNSAMELYTTARKLNAKPILGIEAYMVNPFLEEYVELYQKAYAEGKLKLRSKAEDKVQNEIRRKAMDDSYLHVTVHFKDHWAYQYFCRLSKVMWERAIVKYGEAKPMITIQELADAKGHVTITSSCMRGPVQYCLLGTRNKVIPADPAKAERMYCVLREIAGADDFYVEVLPHAVTHDWKRPEIDHATKKIIKPGFFQPNECTCDNPTGDLQKPLNEFVLKMAAKYGDKPVISLDSHFATPNQQVIQNCRLSNGMEAWRFYESYHIMSSDEAAERLQKTLGVDDATIADWIDNSWHWASKFDSFKLPTNKDRWILEGDADAFMARLKSTIDKYGRMDWTNQVMIERLKYEIRVLSQNGKLNLLSYFATVEDIANYCRDNHVLINVRGSAGGSLLLYLIGVSSVNPLKHDLSFERFLTEGRIKANTLPDADIDVSDRDKVLAYLEAKYGDKYCKLSTDTLLKIKSSIKDAERAVLGSIRPDTEKMVNKLPNTPQGVDDKEFVFGKMDEHGDHTPGIFDQNLDLQKYAKANPEIWTMVSELLGIQRNKGTHACGVIICDKPVTDYMPIIKVSDDWATAFSPKSLEAAGGVKYDILGLNTLRDIQSCLDSIMERHRKKIDPWNLPYDVRCFDAFARGETVTVFQFDSPTVRPLLVGIKPKNIDGLSAVTALGRPGTLDAPSDEKGLTLAQLYVERAKGNLPIRYVHDDLAPILEETMGVQLYQESTLKIYRDIGGFSYEEAEVVRRGIGKKDEAVLASSTSRLKEACLKRGWNETQVNLLIEQIMASARYSFNKSHATAYAYVAYACMWLKINYPLEWWRAILSNSTKDEMATKFWRYVQDFTTLPDINQSSQDYNIVGNRIVSPLSILSGVGEKAYEQLVRFTPYRDLTHFMNCHFKKNDDSSRSPVHSGIVRKLIAAGALDSLFAPNTSILDKLTQFEQAKAVAKNVTKVEAVPEEYYGITALGYYMIKKQIVSIHSEDLRPIMLPGRGGREEPSEKFPNLHFWILQDQLPVLDGNQIEWLKDQVVAGKCSETMYRLQDSMPKDVPLSDDRGYSYYVHGLAYVIGEKNFEYKGKTRSANRMVVDINGHFAEEMLWPHGDQKSAPLGFKGLPCLLTYRVSEKGVSLSGVTPLLRQDELEKYNMT